VLLFEQFSNHCLANAVEPLRAANGLLRREVYRWDYLTLDGKGVTSSSGLPVTPHGQLSKHPGGDHLIVMSSYGFAAHANPSTSRALQAASARFRTLVGMDTGAWLMAEAGLLNALQATIHWDELTAFAERFAEVDVVSERFVIGERTATCGGAMTAFELVLELLRRRHGEALRLEVASLFMHQTASAPAPSPYRHQGSERVAACIELMSSHLEEPLTIGDLAAHVQTDQRQLNRLFQAELGAPPNTVYKRLRLTSARRYAEHSDCSVAEIAVRCGYKNAAALTRAFVQEFGSPPTALRNARYGAQTAPPFALKEGLFKGRSRDSS